MKEKKALPLGAVIFLEVLVICLPVGCLVFSAFTDFIYITNPIFIICAVISVLVLMISQKYLKAMHTKSIREREYDEFGNSKKMAFENLSRREREAIDKQKTVLREQLIPSSVLKKITKHGSEHPREDMDKIIGMPAVKEKMLEMAFRMEFEREELKRIEEERKQAKKEHKPLPPLPDNSAGKSGRHMIFYGSPGTGKTTVARIMAGFLYQNGFIKENKVIEINGGFLKAGEYSEEKTKIIIQESFGGVLFIDEAYSIIEGNGAYGKAVIAELIKEMEDSRDRFICILAGYKKDMKRLVDTNEGFQSRVKEYLEFEDYTVEELTDIFILQANSMNFEVDDDAIRAFQKRVELERQDSAFANGRTVRNILDESIDHHALNFGKGLLIDKETGDKESYRHRICGMDISETPDIKRL